MQHRRLLVVDDDEDIREIATASLEMTTNWTVLSAKCGSEGIATAVASHPDAILLDVMMPDMDGPTAFRILRADPRTSDIPVILLTAKVQARDQQRYLRLGVDGVIGKPFDPLMLAARVVELLRWSEASLGENGGRVASPEAATIE